MTDWRLPHLLRESGISIEGKIPEVLIRGVCDDSRMVSTDTLFIAVKGAREDGHLFIEEAIRRGASAVLTEKPLPVSSQVVQIRVPATRPLVGPLMHTFFGKPSRQIKTIGVTGTNGKTTVTWLIQHLLESADVACGLIGTILIRDGKSERPSTNTTPGAAALQAILAQIRSQGLAACSMEVSSHALDQHRTDGIDWAGAVFTNASPEHLDYHGSFEDYLRAKLRLFESLAPTAAAVVNRDDPSWKRICQVSPGRVVTYSLKAKADFVAQDLEFSMEATRCRLNTPQGPFRLTSPLIGRHNLENVLAALGAVSSMGVPMERMLAGVESFKGVPGRLERIDEGQPFPVLVDYAHTDGALEQVLESLRAVSARKILLVFGCGGNRDQMKRSRMGRVAGRLAHRVVVTSDNPRFEEPQAIADQVAQGLRESKIPWQVILDRREAIQTALEAADGGWLVLIAGKGHEEVQIFGNRAVPFDDRRVARELLKREGVCR